MVKIACGNSHTIVLLDDGTVYGCGINDWGQLGNGNTDSQTSLVPMILTEKIPPGKKVVNIACGDQYTIVLLEDGTVYGCGRNDNGQLGNNSQTESLTLVPMILTKKIPPGKKVVNIACGDQHTIVLLDDGTVYGCGTNNIGQLGIGNRNTPKKTLVPMELSGKKVVNIACGYDYTIVLLDDKTVYGCGYNEDGQLGNGNTITPQPTLVPMTLSEKKVINIACGRLHTIVFLDNKTIYGCGYNFYGQLGNGNNTNTPQPTLVQMKYYNNDYPANPINVTDASTATFSTIFFVPSAITKTYNGNTNLTLTPSMYKIYTYNPLQPIITINMYIATFNNKNVGTNKTLTLNINELKDDENNTNYVFVIPYTTSGNIIQALITPIFTSIPKQYDGNTNANIRYTLNGVVSGETLSITYNAQYITQNIGNNIPINITGIEFIPNIYSSNYILNNTKDTIYGNITAIPLSQYINKYTTLNMLSKLEVNKTNTAAYAVIGYRNTNILVSVFLQNL